MMTGGFALFDTAIGRCGIAWGERGLIAVRLPEADDRAMRASLRRRRPDLQELPPPAEVRKAIDGIVALLDGEAPDLSGIVLDLDGVPSFERLVYDTARTIPPGETLTYGEIATRIGEPGAAREVGQALGHNPFPLVVPCHRVHAAGGKTGGFSAPGGVATKLRILQIESAHAKGTLFERMAGRSATR
jgi:methylated-DNA-[protein]-cysteine S-methyltransferase